MDNGAFQMFNGLGTSGWEWKNFGPFRLTEGTHTLTFAYREDGALLDKIRIQIYFMPQQKWELKQKTFATSTLLELNPWKKTEDSR